MDADGSKTVQHHSIYQRQMGTSVGGVYGICGVSFRSTKGEEAQPFLVDRLSLGMEPAEKVGWLPWVQAVRGTTDKECLLPSPWVLKTGGGTTVGTGVANVHWAHIPSASPRVRANHWVAQNPKLIFCWCEWVTHSHISTILMAQFYAIPRKIIMPTSMTDLLSSPSICNWSPALGSVWDDPMGVSYSSLWYLVNPTWG